MGSHHLGTRTRQLSCEMSRSRMTWKGLHSCARTRDGHTRDLRNTSTPYQSVTCRIYNKTTSLPAMSINLSRKSDGFVFMGWFQLRSYDAVFSSTSLTSVSEGLSMLNPRQKYSPSFSTTNNDKHKCRMLRVMNFINIIGVTNIYGQNS